VGSLDDADTNHEENCMTVTIRLKENGPLLVEGEYTLLDASGNEIPQAKRALCRCGGSTTKPFCDGTHSKIGFQAATAAVASSDK
jgi:CDGSH-type Zn-finger protein